MQKITPNLWFDNNAEEAARFYVSVFKNSGIGKISYYGKEAAAMGNTPGSVMTVEFNLNGQHFLALNGGPHFKFNEAISFAVNCDDQQEIDSYWEKLTGDGGQESRCGWLKDKYGLSWQIVPAVLGKLMTGEAERSGKVMQALLKMKKLHIATLEEAYNQHQTI